ncbi:MAG: CvpA family protein [Desulfovibrionaceae bacterium]|nr:CvpA family protein [Desulfovibrionaceae bacterium]
MNFLDIILICIVALFLLRGFFRGLVQEVVSLVAVILAIVLASNFNHLLQPHLARYIDSEMTVDVLSYTIIFVGTLALFWAVAKLIRTMLDVSLLGWVDRTAGALFGLLEGVLIALIGLMFLHTFAPNADVLTQSAIAPRARYVLDKLEEYIDIPSPQEALNNAKDALGIDQGETEE